MLYPSTPEWDLSHLEMKPCVWVQGSVPNTADVDGCDDYTTANYYQAG